MSDTKTYFKAIIRVVKSLNRENNNDSFFSPFDTVEVLREPLIEAGDKAEVKSILLEKYPQFFPTGKIYEKETKDQAQFFYVVIFPLYNSEIQQIEKGEWTCASCGHVHENSYISRPRINERVYGMDFWFCRSDDDYCINQFQMSKNVGVELPDDINYIKSDSPNYIYKCTEKSSGKCYIGKTKNAPFFRWWNHLTKSNSPFGLYLRQTLLSDWTFEVLEILPGNLPDSEIFKVESKYMVDFDCIDNGFNSVISNKKLKPTNQVSAFDADEIPT